MALVKENKRSKRQNIGIFANNIPPDYGGGGRGAVKYARKLSSEGYNVTVITRTLDANKIPGVKVVEVKNLSNHTEKNLLVRLYWYAKFAVDVAKKILKLDLSLIHSVSVNVHSLIIVLVGKVVRTKTILEPAQEDKGTGGDDIVGIYRQKLGNFKSRIFKLSDAFIAISPSIKERMVKAKIEDNKIRLIPNTVDTKEYRPVNNKCAVKEKLNINFEKTIISVGILSRRKNQKEIVEIFEEIRRKEQDIGLVLLGPNNLCPEVSAYAEEVRKYAREKGFEDEILMPGFKKNVSEWINASDIFVFSSKSEGLPFSVIEAMSCATPCVVKDLSEITKYIFKHGNDGYVYCEKQKAREIILELLNDARKRKNVGTEARKKVVKKFSDTRKIQGYIETYNYLCT